MDRLLLAAQQIKGIGRFADLARLLNESEQLLNNWTRRGIPAARILSLSKIIGCDPYWLESGEGVMRLSYVNDKKINVVLEAMQQLPEYKKDILVQTSTALAESANQNSHNGTK